MSISLEDAKHASQPQKEPQREQLVGAALGGKPSTLGGLAGCSSPRLSLASDTSFSCSVRSSSPSSGSSVRSSFNARSSTEARLQDKMVVKGKARMMRDYIPTHINIMLYGESGLGKTTCIKNMIGDWEVDQMGEAFGQSRPGGKTSLEAFKRDPNSLKVRLKPIRCEEANRDLILTFQDMPGWGDEINLVNSVRGVVSFLLQQRQADFHLQDGGFPVHGAPTHRGALHHGITVCLYFLPPHRVKPVDWIMMAAISKVVSVVPIIAKADSFTAQEMEAFRAELLQVIDAGARSAAEAAQAPTGPRTSGCGAGLDGLKSTRLTGGGASVLPNPRSNGGARGSAGGAGASAEKPSLTAARTTAPLAGSGALGEGEIGTCLDVARDLCLETYTFTSDVLESIDVAASRVPPFAIVASPDLLPADAPEVMGMCCPAGGHTTEVPRELWPSAGEPYRRYPWGTAFPLNRCHSDLVILKQLLTGHCNTAIYDLLDDSWSRAVLFAEKYRQLLVTCGGDFVGDLLEQPAILDPLVDEICTFGSNTALQDRLRDEEQRKLRDELEHAAARMASLEETVASQKAALSSLQQQLTQVLQERAGLSLSAKKLLTLLQRN